MKIKEINALYINAHPDDDILVAGTVMKMKERGFAPYEIIVTDGENVNNFQNSKKVASIRKKEIYVFCRLVGIKRVYRLREIDGLLTNNQSCLIKMVKIIRKIQPRIVVLPNPEDYHKDHRTVYQISLDALEMATRHSYRQWGKPIETPLILICDGLNLLSNPDIVVDISSVFEKKISFIRISYPSQLNSSLLDFLQGVALVRGSRIKTKYAEAFRLGKLFSRPTLSKQSSELVSKILG